MQTAMNDDYIHVCDLCGADAGEGPYHATMNNNKHVHICAACFDPHKHDVGVLQQRYDLLKAENDALREALSAVISWFPSADTYRRLGLRPFGPNGGAEGCQGRTVQGG